MQHEVLCAICDQAPVTYVWVIASPDINLPPPPKDLVNTPICDDCFCDGETMEIRIRTALKERLVRQRVHMPDGTDGLNCVQCGSYYPYVEPNSDDGYICFKHRKNFAQG